MAKKVVVPVSKEQAKAEADLLREMLPYVRHFSIFGDDNHQKIKTQLDAVTAWLNTGHYLNTDNISHDATREEADYANNWLAGQVEGLLQNWHSLAAGIPLTLAAKLAAHFTQYNPVVKTKETKGNAKGKAGAGSSGTAHAAARIRGRKSK